jgi:hypothetical protein
MQKKNIVLPVVAIAVIAVLVIAVAGVLGFKAFGPEKENETTTVTENNTYEYEENTFPAVTHTFPESSTQITSAILTSTQLADASTTKKATTTKAPVTQAPTTQPPVSEPPAKGELDPDDMSHSSGTKQPVTPSKNLPKDMSLSGLYSSGYDVIGLKPYIYNNDKDPNCPQRAWGYNPTYDALAGLIDFSIETTRIDFKYEGKPYRIQLWKGQYISGDIGTVGGEIGLYTKTPGKIYLDPQHYDCAAEEDWLKMEMTILWDEFDDGVYRPQLTRNYDDFWWPTGFVDGQLKNLNDSNSLRLLGRITFESAEQAQLFAEGMRKKGFTEVSTFNPNNIDTFKIYDKDVIFIWQNIR